MAVVGCDRRLPEQLEFGKLESKAGAPFFMSQAELRASLHAKIDALDGSHLALVERVLLTLEAEELSAQLDAGFDADRQAGLLTPTRIETAVAEARAARPYR